jgi:hypothetical protein
MILARLEHGWHEAQSGSCLGLMRHNRWPKWPTGASPAWHGPVGPITQRPGLLCSPADQRPAPRNPYPGVVLYKSACAPPTLISHSLCPLCRTFFSSRVATHPRTPVLHTAPSSPVMSPLICVLLRTRMVGCRAAPHLFLPAPS